MLRPACLASLLASACIEHPLAPVALKTTAQLESTFCVDEAPSVDVLLVIDDSASMGDTQHLLARGLARFGETYDDSARGPIDYRIAVTTTSVTNSWCDDDLQDGAFVDSSCRTRGDDLHVGATHESPAADMRELCLDACGFAELPIEPTSLGLGDTPRRRPWIEHIGLQRNFPDDVPAAAVLPCMGLVGVSGCTYEAPLEAAYLALARARDPSDAAYGFLRPDAALFILFITDEVDCSVPLEHAGIFDPAGSRELWAPGATEPTSAICWNAAMSCDRSVVPYACAEADEGPLHPLARYTELLAAIELDKQHASGTDAQRVFVHVLGGTPENVYELEDMRFGPGMDADREMAFGIAPGCMLDDADPATLDPLAHPPGRLRQIADLYAEDVPLHSLCSSEYATALACVPGVLDLTPACVVGCAADVDASTPELEVDCAMIEHAADGTTRTIPDCEGEVPPAGEDSCVRWTTGDDTREVCAATGTNVDYALVRPSRRAPGSCVEITCRASMRRLFDCPYSS